jgi:putative flippase GtrA
MASSAHGLYTRVRQLMPELLKFGVVGGIGSVIDLGGAAVLHSKYHVSALEAKALSTAAATVVTYLGSRFWTFKHRENQDLHREAVLFIVLNLIGLLIAEVVVGFVTYGLGRHGQLDFNAASVVGTGLATIFRYFAYKRWVFLAPAQQPSAALTPFPSTPAFPDYPPWELDPAYLAAGVTTTGTAPSHSSGEDPAYSWEPNEQQLASAGPMTPPAAPRPSGSSGRHRRQ